LFRKPLGLVEVERLVELDARQQNECIGVIRSALEQCFEHGLGLSRIVFFEEQRRAVEQEMGVEHACLFGLGVGLVRVARRAQELGGSTHASERTRVALRDLALVVLLDQREQGLSRIAAPPAVDHELT
jgi:hypothetical protein